MDQVLQDVQDVMNQRQQPECAMQQHQKQQQAQLAKVQACQVQLLTECQALAQRECHMPQGVNEAMLQELPARHMAMAKELESLRGKVEEVAAGSSSSSGTNYVID